MTDLYYIRNCGCDDETTGLAIIPEAQFAAFKQIIEDLNKNSTYGCMPTICVYKIDESMLRKPNDFDVDSEILYLGEKNYVLKHEYKRYDKLEELRVI